MIGTAFCALSLLTLVLFIALGAWFWLLAPNMPWAIKLAISIAFSVLGTALPYWENRDSRHDDKAPERLWQRLKSQTGLGLILNLGLAAAYYLS